MGNLTKREVGERVRRVVAHVLCTPTDEIKAKDHFRRDLGADSLDVVEIIIALHKEFPETVFETLDCDIESCFGTVEEATRYFYRFQGHRSKRRGRRAKTSRANSARSVVSVSRAGRRGFCPEGVRSGQPESGG